MRADERMGDRRRLRPGLLRDVLVAVAAIAGEPLCVIENAAPAAEAGPQPAGRCRLGRPPSGAEGPAALPRRGGGRAGWAGRRPGETRKGWSDAAWSAARPRPPMARPSPSFRLD